MLSVFALYLGFFLKKSSSPYHETILQKKGKKKPHCMKWHKIEPTSKREEEHLKNVRISAWPLQFQCNYDVIRDQSLGKINVKTSATVRGRWQERRTFGVRLPGFKSITPTYS